jgi:nucleotide-binding universal stress UspA family protein
MRRILAAITGDSAAPAVIASARALAPLFSATVQVLHVGTERAVLVSGAVARAEVALKTVPGEVVQEIVDEADSADVAAVVIGARGEPAGRRPAGGTALALIASLSKPVVAVAPDTAVRDPIRRVLVPLDGTMASAAALREIVELASGAKLQIVVAHVHPARSLPAFGDHLPHEVQAWSEEFIARHCPGALNATLELRVGEPHEHVLDILRCSACDLVALGWSQDLSGGRAAVVRRMLAESPVPVLLTPAGGDLSGARQTAGVAGARAEEGGRLLEPIGAAPGVWPR